MRASLRRAAAAAALALCSLTSLAAALADEEAAKPEAKAEANADVDADVDRESPAELRRSAGLSDRLLDALVEVSGVPGLGAAVWRDGKILWTGSAGMRDLDKQLPVEPTTVFRLASVSKIVAAVAAAKLRQDGKLDVDAKVGDLVPDLPPRLAEVTTRQLAAHTSGLPHYQAVDEKRGSVHYDSVSDALAIFKDRELLGAPGAAYRYSSWGYVLLSAVVEKAAGMPYLEYLARFLTTGLLIYPDVTDVSPRASRAYQFVDEKVLPAPPHDFSYSWGGGGLGATPSAIAEFGGRLLGDKLISRETWSWMLVPSKLSDGRFVEEDDYQVGFGLRTSKDLDGNLLVHHGGVTLGARSALVMWPELNASAALLSNALWTSAIEQSTRILAAPFLPDPKGLPRLTCPTEAVRYEGQFGDRNISGTARFSKQGGACVGKLEVAAAWSDYWNPFPQANPKQIQLIGLAAEGAELGRAALVTPAGLYELRASPGGVPGGLLVGRFGPTRVLTLSFRDNRSALPPP